MLKLDAEFYFSAGTLPFSGTPKSKKIKRLAFSYYFNNENLEIENSMKIEN